MEKRKREDSEEDEQRKRARPGEQLKLTDFPDDILLVILRNLEHDSLLSLSRTCEQFRRVCQDHTLWRVVDFGEASATPSDMDAILDEVTDETVSIRINGWNADGVENVTDSISSKWLAALGEKCKNLKILQVPRHCINCDYVSIQDFPKHLTKLDLSNTQLKHLPITRSYFKDISRLIPNLKSLILSYCKWFEPHSLMAISKCMHLEELHINDCPLVKDCLAYFGLSTRGGFKSLKTLDMRRCNLNCSELVCFSSVGTLANIYLESPWADPPRSCHIDQAIIVLFTQQDMVQIRMGRNDMVTRPYLQVERLIVRNFPSMTDTSLNKLASDAKALSFLDVTGSGVTPDGIRQFKVLRPNVTVVSEFIEE